jgi:cytochrome b561
MKPAPRRYNWLAITLHWVMALSFIAMLGMGLVMTHLPIDKSLQFHMYQWHKSLGVLLLLAFFLRLVVRLMSQEPELPNDIKPLEKWAALTVQKAFYFWMFLLPLTGWLMVSSSPFGLPTIVFGWFEWPHIPYVAGNPTIEDYAKEAHELLAYSFILLIGLHIGGWLKHLIFERKNLLPRMGIGRLTEED